MGTPLSAKDAKVRINGNTLFAAKWDVNPETNWLDTTNFESGGYEEQTQGLTKCEVTIEGWYDADTNMHESPLLIFDGASLSNVKLHLVGTSSPYWSFPDLSVKSVPISSEVAGLVHYRLIGKGNGIFYYPSGNP